MKTRSREQKAPPAPKTRSALLLIRPPGRRRAKSGDLGEVRLDFLLRAREADLL